MFTLASYHRLFSFRLFIENSTYFECIYTVINLRNYFRSQCSGIFSKSQSYRVYRVGGAVYVADRYVFHFNIKAWSQELEEQQSV